MFSIQPPTLRGQAVFDACTPHSNDKALVASLKRASDSIAVADDDLQTAMRARDITAYFKRARRPFACDNESLGDLYARVLRDGSQRAIYDKLIYAGDERECRICGASIAGSLDHYLPVSAFPELAVVPANLVPTCLPCNKDKREYTPQTVDDSLFNPFFDNWTAYAMLTARLHHSKGVRVRYSLAQPPGCPDTIYRRAEKTFEVYKLAKNLSVAAAIQFRHVMTSCAYQADKVTEKHARRAAVIDWVMHQYKTLSAKNPNDWQAAMYGAFADSSWFLDGGHALLLGTEKKA
ncbi:HNH endonuclease [Rhizobium ruizarguesonis]